MGRQRDFKTVLWVYKCVVHNTASASAVYSKEETENETDVKILREENTPN